MVKGLMVGILEDLKCSGKLLGVTRAVLVGRGVPEIFEAGPDTPALYLSKWYGGWRATPAPLKDDEKGSGWAFGGRFAYTSDSRLPTLPNSGDPTMPHHLPIAIHDLWLF